MIIRENKINLEDFTAKDSLVISGNNKLYEEALFFDLEHYIYKKPVCIGVFGSCYFDKEENALKVTQYMIENNKDSKEILTLARNYFKDLSIKYKKKYIVSFSGNNDFTVLNYLLNKYNVDYKIDEHYLEIDLQKQYEKEKKVCIGLKNLEKEFGIIRDSELISGSNLAKTFSKIVKDNDYISRMPQEKKDKILLYNEQDVVSLFHMYINWQRVVTNQEDILTKEE